MKLDQKKRLKIYELFIDRIYEITEIKYVFLEGQKQELLKTFTRISVAMDKNEEEDFNDVFVEFNNYIVNSIKSWVKWDKKDIKNLVGFVTSRKSSSVFVLDLKNKFQKDAEELNLAGMRENEEW